MRPDYTNLFTIAANGVNKDVVMAFFYEWQEAADQENIVLSKEKTATIVMTVDNAKQLANELTRVINIVESEEGEAEVNSDE